MNAVNVEVVDEVHGHVDGVFLRQGMSRVQSIGIGLRSSVCPCDPVVVKAREASRGGARVLRVYRAAACAERDNPRVNLNALLAPRCVVSGVDDRLERVEVRRREAGHIRLSHRGRVVRIAVPAHLNDDGVAVRGAYLAGGGGAGNTEQSVHLRLTQNTGTPGVNPEGPELGRASGAGDGQRKKKADAEGLHPAPRLKPSEPREPHCLRTFHHQSGDASDRNRAVQNPRLHRDAGKRRFTADPVPARAKEVTNQGREWRREADVRTRHPAP